MAMRPISVDVYELTTLLRDKADLIGAHLRTCGHPAHVAVDDMGDTIKRMGELHLALREAIAAMPKATANSADAGKRA